MTPAELWWHHVPAGIAIKDAIAKTILDGKCALLDASKLPWMGELWCFVSNQVAAEDAELNWNEIDASQLGRRDPLAYLGHYFHVDQVPDRKMILEKLTELQTCCWVYGIGEGEALAWLELARVLFAGRTKHPFRLVLELPSISVRSIGRLTVVDTTIERFDVYYFALSMLAPRRLGRNYREYAATLCAELADGDVELCFKLCRNIETVLTDPVAGLAASGYTVDESLLRQLICRAQTRNITPLIDIGRLKMIAFMADRIESILPQVDDHKNVIDDIYGVELRHLVYFVQNGMLSVTPEENAILTCLHHARNDISHLDFLPYDRITELFRVLDQWV